MPDEIDWSLTTWEGNRRRQHREFLALSFREKLQALENMAELSARLQGSKVSEERRPPGSGGAGD
jgi:hypothetical protein